MGKNLFIWFRVYLRYNVIGVICMYIYLYMTKLLVCSCEKMIHAYVPTSD